MLLRTDPAVKNRLANLCAGVYILENHILLFRDAMRKETRICHCTMRFSTDGVDITVILA